MRRQAMFALLSMALVHSAQSTMLGDMETGALHEHGVEAQIQEKDAEKVDGKEDPAAAQAPCAAAEALKAIQDAALKASSDASAQGIQVGKCPTVAGTLREAAAAGLAASGKDCEKPKDDKKPEDDDKWFDDEMKKINAGKPCSVPLAPCPPPPPSMLETKAKKDAAVAKQKTDEWKDAQDDAKRADARAKGLRKKADNAKEKAVASFQKAGEEAAEVAKARVATAKALGCLNVPTSNAACEDALKQANAKLQKAKDDAENAEKMAKDAGAQQDDMAEQKKCKKDAKDKADIEAKVAKDNAARIIGEANKFLAGDTAAGNCN